MRADHQSRFSSTRPTTAGEQIFPSYAERSAKLRGNVIPAEVETVTIIDLIRAYGVPDRMKVDIEGADIYCLLDLYGGRLPRHLSIEQPKSLSDQLFALTLLRRMGYRNFAFVDQTEDGDEQHATTGLFGDDLPRMAWVGSSRARAMSLWLYGMRAFGGAIRRTPGLRPLAPRSRWFDIHVLT